ncbi:hypothetical protein Pint_27585 [Pistacia integerrima]|uniref:Uncharacterized protein n=1 Tax=Pistacia integerrima TaxID=434235 RepID=A0ACC0YQ84_9ROSI|nr:hypothetical protein Pint_27585 [Pistacia integerrima]
MVSGDHLSNENPIRSSAMSSSHNPNTQPPSPTETPLVALNITAQINEKLTPPSFHNGVPNLKLFSLGIGDEIALIDHPISDDDLTLYILNELHDLLVGHDSYLRRLETATQQLVVSANYTNYKPNSGSYHYRNQGRPSGFSRNQGQNKDSRPQNKHSGRPNTNQKRYQPKCQFCDQIGHTAKSCPQLNSHAVTANCTSSAKVTDNKWLMDSASHNITGDLSNLSIHSEYDGTDETIQQTQNGTKIYTSRIFGLFLTQNAYRCIDPNTRRVYISRHVLFDETQSPLTEPHSSSTSNPNSSSLQVPNPPPVAVPPLLFSSPPMTSVDAPTMVTATCNSHVSTSPDFSHLHLHSQTAHSTPTHPNSLPNPNQTSSLVPHPDLGNSFPRPYEPQQAQHPQPQHPLTSRIHPMTTRQINQQQIMQIFRPRSRQITQQQIMQIANHADIQTKNCATDFLDVVISTLAIPQHLQQLKLISEIKKAGNIQRFVPSEYGNEVDRVSALPPFEAVLENKRKIRRATEEAGISYTYVSANSFATYFVDYLLHPNEQRNEVIVYGSGLIKAVLNYEEDVAAYTVKASTDPRVANLVIIYRSPGNIVSQFDLISAWEKKTGRNLKKIHVAEEEIIKLSEVTPPPGNVPPAILHNIFIKGDQMSFELTSEDLEASQLYPEYKYTSVDELLDICLVKPTKVKLATF